MEWLAEHFTEWLGTYGYPVLFVGVLLENAGLPVPGETAVLLSGFLASQEGYHFHIVGVVLTTVVAAVLGDNLGFWLGRRWARTRLQAGKRFLFLTPQLLQIAEKYFERYGVWTIFVARFITGLRVVGALAAGTAGMPWGRFLVANVAGAVAWALVMALLGYFFGHSWQLLHHWLGRGGLIILGTVVLLVGLPYLLRRLHTAVPDEWKRFLRSQIVFGVLAALLEVICIGLLVLVARDQHPAHWEEQLHSWIGEHDVPGVRAVALVASYLGILPVMVLVTVALTVWLRSRQRSGREMALVWGSLVVSETVGLLLLALIRHGGIEPERTLAWPYGFAGLAPLRGAAVLGVGAWMVGRLVPPWGRSAKVVAGLLVLLIGFGVVWLGEQRVTEVLLEYAAGGVLLFAGLWWLEGYGPGVVALPGDSRATDTATVG